jgi:hypothetical protein
MHGHPMPPACAVRADRVTARLRLHRPIILDTLCGKAASLSRVGLVVSTASGTTEAVPVYSRARAHIRVTILEEVEVLKTAVGEIRDGLRNQLRVQKSILDGNLWSRCMVDDVERWSENRGGPTMTVL